MEKKLCIAGLICLATLLGCEKRQDAATDLEAPAFAGNAVEETPMADVKEKRRPSHADFQQGFNLYRQKKYDEAAEFIRQGNASLKGELSNVQGDLKQDAVQAVREITLLVGKVKDGKLESPQALQEPLSRAQRVVARNYFAHVQENAKTQPADEMAYQVNLGLQALENSFAYGNNQAQAGMQPLIGETRQLVQDPKSLNRDQVVAQLQKLTAGLPQ
jgi:hypothetical protein